MIQKTFLLSLIFVALGGCSNNMSRAMYEGIKTQNDAAKTPGEKAINPSPSYDTYKKEKEGLK